MSTSLRQSLRPRQAETAERLMRAGLEELEDVGHEALTIRGVAHRAGVSPATAYTYLASKHHLFAELFWRFLADDEGLEPTGETPVERVRSVVRRLSVRLASSPALPAAVTPALLGTDPDVERLRLRIGAELAARVDRALGEAAGPVLTDALLMAISGALLQSGMQMMTYTEMGERLDGVVTLIMEGVV